MSKVEDFFTEKQEQQIIDAIRTAEKNTSGEIRVHLENSTTKKALDRAKEVFSYLKMNETKEQNGVLFYLDVLDKEFAIIGDKGIDKKVSTDFWNSTKEIVLSKFKNKKFTTGLVLGIEEAGKQLQKHFPYNANKDSNELEDTLSKS